MSHTHKGLKMLIYEGHTISFQTFFVWAFKIDVVTWKFSMLLLYILWDDWPIFYDFTFKWTATAAIGIHSTKHWLSQLVNFKNAIWHLRRTICNKILFKLGKMPPQKRMECFRLLLEHLAGIEHQFMSGIRKAGSLWGMMRSVGGVRKSRDQSWLAKGLGLGLLYWCFKRVQEEIPWEEALHSSNWVSGISTRTIHQSTTPSLSQIIWPRWASSASL